MKPKIPGIELRPIRSYMQIGHQSVRNRKGQTYREEKKSSKETLFDVSEIDKASC